MRTLVLSLLMSILVTGSAAAPARDDGVETLRERFTLLHRSLSATGGVHERDHAAIESLRDDVAGYRTRNRDDVEALAMQLQLSIWLEDSDAVNDLFEALVELEPDRPALRMSWVDYVRRVEGDDEVGGIYERLVRQNPDDVELRRSWADWLRQRNRYAEAIEVLERPGVDVSEHPRLALLLANCLFAQERFQESLDVLEAITAEQRAAEPGITGQVDQALATRRDYVEFWAAEQELRSQEEAEGDLPRARIETAKGAIVVELFESQAPNTVANFIALAESGFYDGLTFHRVIPNFMAQAGDPRTRDGGDATTDGPGYRIPDEHAAENARRHFTGSLAMANTGQPDTGGSQFYITVEPTFHLNGKHTVFGRVIDGLDVVRAIEKDDALEVVEITRKRDHAYEPETLEEVPAIPDAAPLTIDATSSKPLFAPDEE